MSYQDRKGCIAVLIVFSVFITIIAAVFVQIFSVGDSILFFEIVAGGAALVAGLASYLNIMMSRRLSKAREQQRIFIIYAREDIDVARKLVTELREHGFKPWLDLDEITAGEIWQKAVIRALEESAVALVLISKNLSKNGFVNEELKVALETLQAPKRDMSPLLPVRLDDSEVPKQLSHVQWVDLYEKNGMEQLLNGLAKAF